MLTHWHIRSVLLALFVLTCASTADDTNRSSGLPTYRSTVSEVRVTFFATDENNHPVATLAKSDFAVVDRELVIRKFRSFTHSDETTLDLVALVDLSESMAPRLRVAINAVLQLVEHEQSIPADNFAVLSFGGELRETSGGPSAAIRPAVLCASGCGAFNSVSRLLSVKSGGTTPLFDALIFAAGFIAHNRRAGARPVLILFSDGIDTISLHSAREAQDAVLDGGVLIYAVDIGISNAPNLGRHLPAPGFGSYGRSLFLFLSALLPARRRRHRTERCTGGPARLLRRVLRSAQPSGRISFASTFANAQPQP
jgi:hypothetical protein